MFVTNIISRGEEMRKLKLFIMAFAIVVIMSLPVLASAGQNESMTNVKSPNMVTTTMQASGVTPEIGGFGSIVFVCFDGGNKLMLCEFQINADQQSGAITWLNAKVKFSDSYVQGFNYPVPNLWSAHDQAENYVTYPGRYWGELSGSVTTWYAYNTIVPVRSYSDVD